MTNNKLPFERFIRFYIALEIILTFIYVKKLSIFSISESRVHTLVVLIAAIAGSILVLSWKRERNWISLLCGTLLPLLVFEAITLWRYCMISPAAIIAGSVAAAGAGCLLALRKTRQFRQKEIRRELVTIKSVHVACMLACLLFFGSCVYGRILIEKQISVFASEILYQVSDPKEDVVDYENSLAANIETVAKLDLRNGWRTLSDEEKMEVIKAVVRVECRYLGMTDSAPTLEFAHMEEDVLGVYDWERDSVTLSYNFVCGSGSDGYAVLETLCHEMYHRYQRYQVDLLKALRDMDSNSKYVDLLLLYNAGIYEEESASYVVPSDDSPGSYYLYSSQKLEQDARRYSHITVPVYRERIWAFLDEQEG